MDQDLADFLEAVRDKRGYLLPHHGLMAVTSPALLDSYDRLYTELTLKDRVLTKHEHEYVWMAILIACEEALGTHHVRRYLDAGGTNDELGTILAVTALVSGSPAHRFVDRHWMPHLPGFDAKTAYLESFREAAGGSAIAPAHMAAAAICTCRGNWTVLGWHIAAAYEDGVSEDGLAEALSLTMFPGGVPNFVDAADVWRRLILAEAVDASPPFRTWAALSGQGGYDEASGVTPADG